MKRHTFDALSFISGLLIAGIGLAYLLPEEPADIIDTLGAMAAWFWPTVFVLIGFALLAPLVTRTKQKESEDPS